MAATALGGGGTSGKKTRQDMKRLYGQAKGAYRTGKHLKKQLKGLYGGGKRFGNKYGRPQIKRR